MRYFSDILRTVFRSGSQSLINLVGLSVGLTVSILILIYVNHETSYDHHLDNFKNKYRMNIHMEMGEFKVEGGVTNGQLSIELPEKVPGIVRIASTSAYNPLVHFDDGRNFQETSCYYANQSFIPFFALVFLQGNPEDALIEPFSAVLTESQAKKYFGDQPALGKVFAVSESQYCTVTGVVADLPNSTNFSFDMLVSLTSMLSQQGRSSYKDFGNSFESFIELESNLDIGYLGQVMTDITMSYQPPQMNEMGIKLDCYLQPLGRVHLFSAFEETNNRDRMSMIIMLVSVAFLILLMACVNFMSLATAKFAVRAKEVGIRKIHGISRKSLVVRFLGESVMLGLFATLNALVLAELLLPLFNQMTDSQLSVNFLKDLDVTSMVLCLGVLTGLLAGIYPAVYLSRFRPITVLKGQFGREKGGKRFRQAIVALQFLISTTLILCTLTVQKQLRLFQNQSPGFVLENRLVVELGPDIRQNADIIKDELSVIPGVSNLSVTSGYPASRSNYYDGFKFEGIDNPDLPPMALLWSDLDFVKTMGIQITNGRNFSHEFSTDSTAVLINEFLVNMLGWDDPIGKRIIPVSQNPPVEYHVVGVINNFNYRSLHTPLESLLITWPKYQRFIVMEVDEQKTDMIIDASRNTLEKHKSKYPFTHYWIEDQFLDQYQQEIRLGNIFIGFTLIALLIGLLGILGLSVFITQRRTREISIRKVLGASVHQVEWLVSKEMLILLLLSNVAAWIIGGFIMRPWLQDFAYRVKISVDLLMYALAGSLLIVLLSTGFVVYRIARTNAADALRHE